MVGRGETNKDVAVAVQSESAVAEAEREQLWREDGVSAEVCGVDHVLEVGIAVVGGVLVDVRTLGGSDVCHVDDTDGLDSGWIVILVVCLWVLVNMKIEMVDIGEKVAVGREEVVVVAEEVEEGEVES